MSVREKTVLSEMPPLGGETESVAEWGGGLVVMDTLADEAPRSLVAVSWKVWVRWGGRRPAGRTRLIESERPTGREGER